jgi:predicted AlkP superfamily pyrophosphatase or phosphodiesterase
MAPKNVVISLDGATFSILQDYLSTNQLDPDTGLGLLANEGILVPSTTTTASLTAPGHISIATGSTAAHNDINANSFHLVASPFESNISGFGAPIGGYDVLGPDAPGESDNPTAEPLWLRLREAGKKVVAATFPGADGVTVRLPGVESPGPILQSSEVRTVDYTVPFGAFGGIGARGFSLDASDFTVDPTQAEEDLADLGITSFSDVMVAELETIPAEGQGSLTGGSSDDYELQVTAIDTTDDNVVNYNELIVFDANRGIEAASSPPSTGSAFVNIYDQTISPFYFEGSNNKVGAAFIPTNLAPDLSTVRLIRTAANYIPRPEGNPEVIENVDDINNNVGFWQPQPDFRIPERISPGLEDFPNTELEAAYEDLVETFVDYQTDVLLRAIERNPDADLVLGYVEQPDGSEHQFLLTDPRQPTAPSNPNSIGAGQDPATVQRYADYVLNAYQTVSDTVQRVIDEVGVDENGVPNSNIIIVSDHGFAPFHTGVNADKILADAGFDPDQVRVVTSGPAANIYINLEGREPNGTVDPSEYKALQERIVQTLESVQDTNSTYAPDKDVPLFDEIYARPVPDDPTVEDIVTASNEFIGQDTGDIVALLSLGYNFDGFQADVPRQGDPALADDELPIFSVPNFYGAHGYDPTLPEMQAIFLAAGPDFSPEALQVVDGIQTIDIAPTILDLLDVEPAPTVDGESIFSQTAPGDGSADGNLEPVFGSLESDTLDVSSRDALVFAGAGDDLINAISSEGGNQIYAGTDNDTLILGGGDRLFGGGGDDLFFAQTGGDNLITGGAGADQFWMAVAEIPDAANTVTDFVSNEDVIGIAGLDVDFTQLTISQDGNNARIAFDGNDLAVLTGIEANSLSAANFVFV